MYVIFSDRDLWPKIVYHVKSIDRDSLEEGTFVTFPHLVMHCKGRPQSLGCCLLTSEQQNCQCFDWFIINYQFTKNNFQNKVCLFSSSQQQLTSRNLFVATIFHIEELFINFCFWWKLDKEVKMGWNNEKMRKIKNRDSKEKIKWNWNGLCWYQTTRDTGLYLRSRS